jgi:hypothetical protein
MNRIVKGVLLAGVAVAIAAPALAKPPPPPMPANQLPGNECKDGGGGVLAGRGFNNCSLNGSPVIIKFNTPGSTEINPLFPSVTGSEFTFTAGTSGTWT